MLDSLKICNFRCFDDLEIPSLGRANLIVGKNNTGKSTLLEAVRILAGNGDIDVLRDILEDRHEFFSEHGNALNEAGKVGLWRKMNASNHYAEEVTVGDLEGTRFVSSKQLTSSESQVEVIENDVFLSISSTIPYATVATILETETKLAKLWDEVYLNSEDQFLQDALHILNPDITSLMFVQHPDQSKKSPESMSRRVAVVKLKGQAKAVSLKSMGEGISRLLQIFLHAFFARDGYLMIDEFENGLHYSIQEEVLEKLFKLAKELNIQVFMTTHSKDVIKAFSKVSLASPEEGRLISLGRNERDPENKAITALVYNEDDIKLIAETDMEVR